MALKVVRVPLQQTCSHSCRSQCDTGCIVSRTTSGEIVISVQLYYLIIIRLPYHSLIHLLVLSWYV